MVGAPLVGAYPGWCLIDTRTKEVTGQILAWAYVGAVHVLYVDASGIVRYDWFQSLKDRGWRIVYDTTAFAAASEAKQTTHESVGFPERIRESEQS